MAITSTFKTIRLHNFFASFSRQIACLTGHPAAFTLAVFVTLAWTVTGFIIGFSQTWLLILNTGTSMTTFLMVFIIQSAQNRDTQALQIKLDELIRATKGAHNFLLVLEELSSEELDKIKEDYLELAKKARQQLREGKSDTGNSEA